MRHPLRELLAPAALLLTAIVGTALGQENLPMGPSNYEHDFQLFAPYDLDLDNMADDQWSGYFFEYNKLFWSYTGERVTVGNQNVFDDSRIETPMEYFLKWRDPQNPNQPMVLPRVQGQYAETIYRFNPGDTAVNSQDVVTLPVPYVVTNTLHNVPPRAGFALGNRYEFGYQDQGHGWTIGILDGPQLNQTENYGFTRVDTNGDGIPDGLPPFIDPDYTDGSDIGPLPGTSPDNVGEARAFGFGSVPIIFRTPPGYLLGFRDYVQNLAPAQQGTVAGPLLYVGNYGMPVFNEGDTIDDNVLFRRADDLDADGVWGDMLVLQNGKIIHMIDFDDLHEFNIFFDTVTVHNHTETDGVELMWTHDLTNGHYMAKHKNNRVSISGGARFLRLQDNFRVDAFGSILHDAFWDTTFTNSIVGPQVLFQWVNERQRWRIASEMRFMWGYNVADWEQEGIMGIGMVPGALNQPLYGRPTAFSHGLREQEFSPVGELRVHASYHFTKAFALKFGYTGSYIGNIRRAAPSVFYNLPDMGYVDTGGENLLVNGFDLGVEFVY